MKQLTFLILSGLLLLAACSDKEDPPKTNEGEVHALFIHDDTPFEDDTEDVEFYEEDIEGEEGDDDWEDPFADYQMPAGPTSEEIFSEYLKLVNESKGMFKSSNSNANPPTQVAFFSKEFTTAG